jgi:hypothetical protein
LPKSDEYSFSVFIVYEIPRVAENWRKDKNLHPKNKKAALCHVHCINLPVTTMKKQPIALIGCLDVFIQLSYPLAIHASLMLHHRA